MTRSTYGDCQGDRGAVSTSVIPMPAKRSRAALSLANIAFGEIHNAALCYGSLKRSHFWSRDTAQRHEALVARL